jgi:predicted MarR family transcription regulator
MTEFTVITFYFFGKWQVGCSMAAATIPNLSSQDASRQQAGLLL